MATLDRPNILLITTDQQRYDALGCNGAGLVRTPNIDALAASGSRFDAAYIQNPVCIPSRACMQTGRYTSQHGVDYMESVIDTTPGLPPWERTFMDRLQETGYRTAAFGKIHMMPERGFHDMQVCGGKGARWDRSNGLPFGAGPLGNHYASWLEQRRLGGYELIYRQRREQEYSRYKTAISNVLPLEEYVDYWIGQNTADYLRTPPPEPFFVWCGFCGPHGPIDPPAPYDSMYSSDEVELPPNFRVDGDGNPREPTAEEEEVLRRWIAYYFGLCTLIDDQVAAIMDVMSRRGLWEDTLVIYVSDHGEMMGERGRFGKGNFTEPVIRVPLVVVPPLGESCSPEIADLVETMDIAPTVLDYAGLTIPDAMAATSLRPILEGAAPGREMIMCEYTTNDQARSGKCLRTGNHKYCFWSPDESEEFYDLAEDPLERTNHIGSDRYRDQIDHHRRLLLRRLTETGRGHVGLSSSRVY